MAKIIDLQDLLRHEIMDLYSAEEQIIEALPKMAEKANNPELKKALQNHLRVTKEQKNRLDEVQRLMGKSSDEGESGEGGGERAGFFARLFGNATGSGGEKCKGTEGLIEEGEKMMAEDMTPEALDAAIIGSCQKIEHYEISGYGTARAFARELNLGEVATLLEQTLNEEYEADDQLTTLAVGKLNTKAEMAEDGGSGRGRSSSSKGASKSSSKGGSKSSKGSSNSGGSKGGSKSSSSKGNSKGSSKGGSKSSSKSSSSKGASKSSSSKGGSKSGKGSSKSSGGSKGGSKGSSSKGSSKGSSKSGGSKSGRGGSKALRRR